MAPEVSENRADTPCLSTVDDGNTLQKGKEVS